MVKKSHQKPALNSTLEGVLSPYVHLSWKHKHVTLKWVHLNTSSGISVHLKMVPFRAPTYSNHNYITFQMVIYDLYVILAYGLVYCNRGIVCFQTPIAINAKLEAKPRRAETENATVSKLACLD